MNVNAQIEEYMGCLPQPKQEEVRKLHEHMIKTYPQEKRWFEDGKNEAGKVVSNPNIGYGTYTIHYANGSSRAFFRTGISANTGGISVYIMGLKDKTYLASTYGDTLGKAKITGYCIKFKSLKDINLHVLLDALAYGMHYQHEQ